MGLECEIDPTERDYIHSQGVLDTANLVEAEVREISKAKEKAGKGTSLTFNDIFTILEEIRRATMERQQEWPNAYVKIGYWPHAVRRELGLPKFDP